MRCDYCDQCGAETAANCLQSAGCEWVHAKLRPPPLWRQPMARHRAPLKDVTSSSAVVLTAVQLCLARSLFSTSCFCVCVRVCVSQRLFTLYDWTIFLTIFFPDDFFGGARIGSANGEACFTTGGEETTGCLCLLPGLKLLWCRRLANELTGNVFRKLASLLASRLAKSNRDTYCSGSENSHWKCVRRLSYWVE